MKKKNNMTVGFAMDRKNFMRLQEMKNNLPPEFEYASGKFSDFLKLLITLGAGELKKIKMETDKQVQESQFEEIAK
jgi:hypothetical protein